MQRYSDEQVNRDLMESAYRLVHCLSPEFTSLFNWSSFLAGLESSDLMEKWLVDMFVVVSSMHIV